MSAVVFTTPKGTDFVRCVLPAEHHSFANDPELFFTTDDGRVEDVCKCGDPRSTAIHSPGHMAAQQAWVEG